ncbi:MAG: transcriptional regulator, partial [Clostridia bacterium]|nr:transcriptional regulator [Clostridia bacterium]
IYEISKTLNIPISTVSNHISILEEAKILFVSTQQGVKKHVKMCNRQITSILFNFAGMIAEESPLSFSTEMPVGQFVEADISAPCGMFVNADESETEKPHVDKPSEFFSTHRFAAELIWFDHGFVSYNFPNKLYEEDVVKLELSFEVCSEIAYYRNDWPSDITVKINDKEAITFLSPGDFGGRQGKFTPDSHGLSNTQYGQLKKITITKNGVFLNGSTVSETPIDEFHLNERPFIKLSIGVKKDAVHRGGINLFGKNFGDYNQSILLTLTKAEK